MVLPEGVEAGGFDAIVGNPPFLGGQKLTGACGTAYREYLVRWVANGARGSADLLAYFLLVANRILNSRGQAGLIGTNTMELGDTGEVGLDQISGNGAPIRAAVKSADWQTRSVDLEYAVVWSSRGSIAVGIPRLLEGRPVTLISSALDEMEVDLGQPFPLYANRGISFQGAIVLGMGFTMAPVEAQRLIERDPRNRDVLFPYINGEDLNSRPDCSGSRWVINFHDWSLDRAERYVDCLDIVRRLVKPERDRNKRAPRRTYWWRYAERAPGLYRSIEGLSRVLAITQTSRLQLPAFLPTGMVYAHKLVVFAWDDNPHFALLSSELHRAWVLTRGSTMRTDAVYTPSDVFETFPLPNMTTEMATAGEALDAYRNPLMIDRQLGLTALYNQVHNPGVGDGPLACLRDIHYEIDRAVAESFGWDDIRLNHGFHETPQGMRFTLPDSARREILKRLLDVNHKRHAEEVARGLIGGKGRLGRRKTSQMELLKA